MVELELPIKAEEARWDAGEGPPEVAHWYYRQPCAGVRYYTFDYRPLLTSRMKRWSQQLDEHAAQYEHPERGGESGPVSAAILPEQ